MSVLFFDQFAAEAVMVLPYQEVGGGVVLAYDRNAPVNGTLASVRNIGDETGKRFLAIDGLNFADQWFGLEINLVEGFNSVKVALKGYPARQVYPKIYFDGGELDLNPIEISENLSELTFNAAHMKFAGLPEDSQNLRLSLMFPSREWFAVGLYSVDVDSA